MKLCATCIKFPNFFLKGYPVYFFLEILSPIPDLSRTGFWQNYSFYLCLTYKLIYSLNLVENCFDLGQDTGPKISILGAVSRPKQKFFF